MVAHPQPARRRPRRPHRRGRGDDRADRLRGARRRAATPAATSVDHRRRHRRPADARGDRRGRDDAGSGRSIVAARYPTQRRLAKALGADASARPTSCPRWCAADVERRWSPATSSPAACDQVFDCVGSSRLARSRRCDRRPRRRGRARRHAGQRVSSTSPALWHREVRHHAAATPTRRDDFDTRHRARPPLRARPARVAPRTRSTTTSDAIAHAAIGRPPRRRQGRLRPEEARAHAPTRIRPRGRPLDATDHVLARRELQPGEAARRPQPGDLPARAARRRSTTSTAPSATRCSTRTTRTRCRRCCSPA